MGSPSDKLLDEFRSLLDETIILVISSDHNLEDPEGFATARRILSELSENVEAEEATGFNPSGLGVNDIVDINPSTQDDDTEAAGAASSDVKSVGGFTVTTESSVTQSHISSGSSKASSLETPGLPHIDVFGSLTDAEKEEQLAQMFTSLKLIDIKLALQKSKGDASLAIDELLNEQWLEETKQRPKGVDGFYISDDDNVPNKRKKKKGKKKKMAKVTLPKRTDTENTFQEAISSDAAHSAGHISLISDKFNLPLADVTTIYEQHKASPGATVAKILNNYIALGISSSDPRLLAEAQQEMDKFPWVPPQYIEAAFEMCSQGDAADVIGILGDYFEKPAYKKYNVPYSVVASGPEEIVLPELTNVSNSRQSPRSPTTIRPPTVDLPIRTLNCLGNLQAATIMSNKIVDSRNHSLSSARAAFRKGGSDPLYRQVGGYYAERSRQETVILRQAISDQANYLVDHQSKNKDEIDLHGVTVQDGINIALDRVSNWWQSLGEGRVQKAKVNGFTVITGIGKHSPDGRSPLRVNVIKALVADGWKVQIQTGKCLITGRQ